MASNRVVKIVTTMEDGTVITDTPAYTLSPEEQEWLEIQLAKNGRDDA